MENISLKRLELGAFEEDSVFSEIGGLNKFNSLNFKKLTIFFLGENGTGKPASLEAIAVNRGFDPGGGSINFNFSTKDACLDLHNYLTVGKSVRRVTDGFFLRAESFYNVATYAENIDLGFSEYGDRSLHYQLRGENFLSLVNHRFRGNGLYLLDEPEAALSPQCQLALMMPMGKLINEGSRFVIISHSPILLAMPDSQIISFGKDSPLEITYEESMPYEMTSLFLNNKNRILSHLFAE